MVLSNFSVHARQGIMHLSDCDTERRHKEEKERLMQELSACRSMLEELRGDHKTLKEKYVRIDRKYKKGIKDARKKKEEVEQQLREVKVARADKVIVTEVKDDTWGSFWEDKTEAYEAILGLKDLYLQTVARIKEDVTAHVQAANFRTAHILRAEINKQRGKLVELTSSKINELLRLELHGSVSATHLTYLCDSVNTLCQSVLTHYDSDTPRSVHIENKADYGRSDNDAEKWEGQNTNRSGTQYNNTSEGHYSHNSELATQRAGLEKVDGKHNTENKLTLRPMLDKDPTSSADPDSKLVIDTNAVLFQQRADGQVKKETIKTEHLCKKRNGRADVNVGDKEKNIKDSVRDTLGKQSPDHARDKIHFNNSETYRNIVRENEKRDPTDSNPIHLHQLNLVSISEVDPPNRSPASSYQVSLSHLKTKAVISALDENQRSVMSPRDGRKVVEARVKLRRWVSSGEAPWKVGAEYNFGSNQAVNNNPIQPRSDDKSVEDRSLCPMQEYVHNQYQRTDIKDNKANMSSSKIDHRPMCERQSCLLDGSSPAVNNENHLAPLQYELIEKEAQSLLDREEIMINNKENGRCGRDWQIEESQQQSLNYNGLSRDYQCTTSTKLGPVHDEFSSDTLQDRPSTEPSHSNPTIASVMPDSSHVAQITTTNEGSWITYEGDTGTMSQVNCSAVPARATIDEDSGERAEITDELVIKSCDLMHDKLKGRNSTHHRSLEYLVGSKFINECTCHRNRTSTADQKIKIKDKGSSLSKDTPSPVTWHGTMSKSLSDHSLHKINNHPRIINVTTTTKPKKIPHISTFGEMSKTEGETKLLVTMRDHPVECYCYLGPDQYRSTCGVKRDNKEAILLKEIHLKSETASKESDVTMDIVRKRKRQSVAEQPKKRAEQQSIEKYSEVISNRDLVQKHFKKTCASEFVADVDDTKQDNRKDLVTDLFEKRRSWEAKLMQIQKEDVEVEGKLQEQNAKEVTQPLHRKYKGDIEKIQNKYKNDLVEGKYPIPRVRRTKVESEHKSQKEKEKQVKTSEEIKRKLSAEVDFFEDRPEKSRLERQVKDTAAFNASSIIAKTRVDNNASSTRSLHNRSSTRLTPTMRSSCLTAKMAARNLFSDTQAFSNENTSQSQQPATGTDSTKTFSSINRRPGYAESTETFFGVGSESLLSKTQSMLIRSDRKTQIRHNETQLPWDTSQAVDTNPMFSVRDSG